MLDTLKSLLSRALPAGRVRWPSMASLTRLTPLVILAICLSALAMMVMQHRDARFRPLFGAQESIPVADMVAALDADAIRYRIHPATGQVLVDEDQLGAARMLLAAKGVVARSPAGLEQVDRTDPLGVSQFVQDVRFRRGLEGELTQSIATLDPVAAARVHLSIAKSSSFILGDGDKSTASVMLTLKPGRKLTKEQISAIVALVAGSVANLDPARVAVVDQRGDHLSARIDPSLGGAAQDNEVGNRVRDDTLRSIRDLLLPTLGEDNFRASVTPDVDNDRVEETREQYGEAPKITQEAVREESDTGRSALGVPGSLSNRPAPPSAASAAQDAPRSAKNAKTRQYAYDRNVVQIRRSPSRLKKLNVAVVLNNAAAPGGAKAWSPEQISNIERLLRNGLGIDEKRSDSLVVSALDFRAVPKAPEVAWWKEPDRLVSAGTWAAYAIGALLAFFFVFRPLLKLAGQWVDKDRASDGDGAANPPAGLPDRGRPATAGGASAPM
ncbi:flagellar basal-body MS-ring/collar protein FliF, partial [Burkholderia sp. Ac-20379]|uniref:flagellar basal-body MS-ring/collar protein FliF n=1 Tax=Burkholderia sp. Ac-20379 TaxID=2703900 RepID=UPI0019824B42|nr:flagellar M-ring protein FliF [Burkholderia sp. Ac-20379]